METQRLLFAALVLGASFTLARPARADDAACIAASEQEIGLRKQGHLREALEKLTLCSVPSCPAEVASECGRRIVAVNAALPTLLVAATDASGNDIARATVSVDGTQVATSLDGRPIPVDPGSHTVRIDDGAGHADEKTLVVREGEKDRHVAFAFASQDQAGGGWGTQKKVAIATGAVGAVGLIVGAITGGLAFSDASTAKNDCTSASCTAQGHTNALSEHSSAQTVGNVSTIAFVVGGVAVAAGVTLWLTAPSGDKAHAVGLTPLVAPGAGGALLGGRF